MSSPINEEKVKKLPQEGVHCFAANNKQITSRRIITIPLMIVFIALACFFLFGKNQSIPLAVIACLAFVIALLVFVQTFLIANYRIAVDYNQKKIVLRYRFSLITIPFENFDARDGEPDRAEALLENSGLSGSKDKVYYLVLDNVLDDACYQTTTKDLASREDFFKLKEEVFAIAEAYGASNLENAIKPETMYSAKDTSVSDDSIDAIVDSVTNESEENK